jgi:hypothetical protein
MLFFIAPVVTRVLWSCDWLGSETGNERTGMGRETAAIKEKQYWADVEVQYAELNNVGR